VIVGLGLAVVLRAVGGGHVFQYCTIQPSPWGTKGAPHQTGGNDGRRERRHKATGKVDGVIYDRSGDFEGFLLLTEEGDQRDFFSREAEIESLARFALEQEAVITVLTEIHEPDRPANVILRRTPQQPRRPGV
jgi:hypothetical protein